jgi:hypothetical protein
VLVITCHAHNSINAIGDPPLDGQVVLIAVQEKELADCTFSPWTIPLPAFMQRLSGAHGSMSHSKSDLESYAQQLKWL